MATADDHVRPTRYQRVCPADKGATTVCPTLKMARRAEADYLVLRLGRDVPFRAAILDQRVKDGEAADDPNQWSFSEGDLAQQLTQRTQIPIEVTRQ